MRMYTLYFVLGLALTGVALPGMAAAASAPQSWMDMIKQYVKSPATQATLPGSEVAAGLKEALAKGTTDAINSLGRPNGFWKNPAVRIPLPGELKQVASLARQLGQGEKVDAFQLSLNRAAEKAVPQVADLFGDAIRKLTLKDAQGILSGGDHAATDYFRRVTGTQLAARIQPIVAKATDSVGITRQYKALMSGASGGNLGSAMSLLGKFGASKDMNLDTYVTDATLDGLFKTIGDEEKSIRENPAARTTELLKKVFASK